MDFGLRVSIWLDTLKVELIVLYSIIELGHLPKKDKFALGVMLFCMIIQIALLILISQYIQVINRFIMPSK